MRPNGQNWHLQSLYSRISDYAFFSSAYGILSRIDSILGYKTSLKKFKKIEKISSIFSDHNALKLRINCKKEVKKLTDMWRFNNTLLKRNWVKKEINGEITRYTEMNENDNMTWVLLRYSERSKREDYVIAGLSQEMRNTN